MLFCKLLLFHIIPAIAKLLSNVGVNALLQASAFPLIQQIGGIKHEVC